MILSSSLMIILKVAIVVINTVGLGTLCFNFIKNEKKILKRSIAAVVLTLCVVFSALVSCYARIPAVNGYQYERAIEVLDTAGFVPHFCPENPYDYRVSLEDPALAGSYAPKGSLIFLVIAK